MGGGLAGSYTLGSSTTTLVPLLDTSGSTIALVNTAQPNAQPTISFTYDPFGTPSGTGISSGWPFQYQGMEHEVTDPASLYFQASGDVYNPQLQLDVSQAGQLSIGEPPGSGSAASGASGFGQHQAAGGQQGNTLGQDFSDLATVAKPALVYAYYEFFLPGGFTESSGTPLEVFFNFNFFGLFSNSGDPETPRQLMHERHPIYIEILGISIGLIADQESPQNPHLLLASSTLGRDDPDFALEGPALDAKIRQLSEQAQKMKSGKERSKLQRKIKELRRRKSERAHGADKNNSKFSWIPLIPEAPLAEEAAPGLPELFELIETFGMFAL